MTNKTNSGEKTLSTVLITNKPLHVYISAMYCICHVYFEGIEDKIKLLHWKITEKKIKTEPHDGSKIKVITNNFVFAMA
jgi:hypothetical protein